MRFHTSRYATLLLNIFAIANVHAQIKLPDAVQKGADSLQQGIRRVGAASQKQGRARAASAASPAQCQALARWLSVLRVEMPKVDLFRMAFGDVFHEQMLNLFRDEYFQPFFGKPFPQTTADERMAFYRSVFPGCASEGQMSARDLSLFEELKLQLARPFTLEQGEFSAESVSAGLPKIQTSLLWMRATLKNLDGVPATAGGFDEITAALRTGKSDLAKLWPRETDAFIETVSKQQGSVAQALLDDVAASAMQEASKGLDGITAIKALYQKNDSYTQYLDTQARARARAQKEQALSSAVEAAVPNERKVLTSLPMGLDGAIGLADWNRRFTTATTGISLSAGAQSLIADAREARRRLLASGLSEFKAVVDQHPKPGRNGANAEVILSKLFPDQNRMLAP